jgi:hypothetical protein
VTAGQVMDFSRGVVIVTMIMVAVTVKLGKHNLKKFR